jgi:hypothetical protein
MGHVGKRREMHVRALMGKPGKIPLGRPKHSIKLQKLSDFLFI